MISDITRAILAFWYTLTGKSVIANVDFHKNARVILIEKCGMVYQCTFGNIEFPKESTNIIVKR